MVINQWVVIDIKDNGQVILSVLENNSERKFTFPSSAEPTTRSGKPTSWDNLKNEIDKINKRQNEHRLNRNRQTGKQGEWDEPEDKIKRKKENNGYDVSISGNKDSCTVEIHFRDDTVICEGGLRQKIIRRADKEH
jgi:hypothetical protein